MKNPFRIHTRALRRAMVLALASLSLAGCVVEPCCFRPHPYYWR